MNAIRAAVFLFFVLGISWVLYAPRDEPAPSLIATDEDAGAPPPLEVPAVPSFSTAGSGGYAVGQCAVTPIALTSSTSGTVYTICAAGGGGGGTAAYGGGGGMGTMVAR